jgi:hypothetical protein
LVIIGDDTRPAVAGSAAVSPVQLPADPNLSPDVGGSIVSAVTSHDE